MVIKLILKLMIKLTIITLYSNLCYSIHAKHTLRLQMGVTDVIKIRDVEHNVM